MTKMLLTKDDDLIQAISAHGTDEPFIHFAKVTEPRSADPVCPWLQDAG
jgi:hypothetical protein